MMWQIIGADDCFSLAGSNLFDTEAEALESLEFLRGEYPEQLDDAYVDEVEEDE